MAALPQLVSVEQFRHLPEDADRYELHHGEVVAVAMPKHWQVNLQHQLFSLLASTLESFGQVAIEVPYRAFPEFDMRVADVAAVSRAHWDAIDPDDNLYGVPELVIEVKSPSNTDRQLRELVSICLNRGALEVWIVDTIRKSVTVMRGDGTPAVFASGATLSLDAFGGGELPVDQIFA